MRTSARYAGAAAVMAAALLVSGCGSSGEDEPQRSGPTAERTTEATEAPGEATGEPEKGLEGTWGTEGGGSTLVLNVSGGFATLLGSTACSGPVAKDADPVTLTLKCGDGSTERTEGTVESVDGERLVVSWESDTEDTFTRIEVPTELPTAIPTDLGDLPADVPEE